MTSGENDLLKKLTSKNPKDYENVVFDLVNMPNVSLFRELVEKDDFLFDFVKQNVANRIDAVCSENNYKNLIQFFKYYSPAYEDVITANLEQFGDEIVKQEITELFKTGSEDEKTYCVKYFEKINTCPDMDLLRQYAYSSNPNLANNSALLLSKLGDKISYDNAINNLDCEDDFNKLDAVKFLVSYGNKQALDKIIETMKKSSLCENIAGEIPYLKDLESIYNKNPDDCLFILNSIITGLGEILSLSQVFDFGLYGIFERLINEKITSTVAVVLLSAIDKFATLTENNEYLFDETKDTKQEIQEIKQLLSRVDIGKLYKLADEELTKDSLFVLTALDFTENSDKVRILLDSSNSAVVIKALETIKMIDTVTEDDKQRALTGIEDKNLKDIIIAI